MSRTRDELAGVVDLFGALTRDELADALAELAFKRGEDVDRDAVDAEIAGALDDYYLVAYDPGGDGTGADDDEGDGADAGGDATGEDATLLVPGPVAFPTLPERAADLPHILDVPDRDVDRDALGAQVAQRVRADAAKAVDAGDAERARTLLDVTYDVETWASVDLSDARERMDAALDG